MDKAATQTEVYSALRHGGSAQGHVESVPIQDLLRKRLGPYTKPE
jgi:hypothetical protein